MSYYIRKKYHWLKWIPILGILCVFVAPSKILEIDRKAEFWGSSLFQAACVVSLLFLTNIV